MIFNLPFTQQLSQHIPRHIFRYINILFFTVSTAYCKPPEIVTDSRNCMCATNTYNCDNFLTQSDAQACFNTCGGTTNDIHKLDGDGNDLACESIQ